MLMIDSVCGGGGGGGFGRRVVYYTLNYNTPHKTQEMMII